MKLKIILMIPIVIWLVATTIMIQTDVPVPNYMDAVLFIYMMLGMAILIRKKKAG